MGFIVTVSYDRALFIYNEEHLHTPKKVPQASASRFTSVAWDKANNWVVTGSADGAVKVWSQEGRCLDQLVQCSDQVCTDMPDLHLNGLTDAFGWHLFLPDDSIPYLADISST